MTTLRITATGMCCAVGYSTAAAVPAIRAGMDHFRETQFVDQQGKPLIGAQLYGIDQWGTSRMGWMFRRVLTECLANENHANALNNMALILIVPEPERPGATENWSDEIYQGCTAQYDFHPCSCVVPSGKVGLASALAMASDFLTTGQVRRVLIAGVDSFFSSAAITHYLGQQRLLTGDNSDGFIPGEAAGAITVTLNENPDDDGLIICGIGQGNEEAHILQDELPNRGTGLNKAIRRAVTDSGSPLTETLFHISAVSHESFYFRETELAVLRSLEHKVADYPHLMLTASTGEVGAASGPLMLAYLASVMPRPDGPGRKGLIHLSDDYGHRAAAIVQWRDSHTSDYPEN
ncbi:MULTISPECIES: hypothetical protein [Citrobacter]|uniref:hypothetical protein n=1 Tax=Citrobacter TaxID=544 RepID=UPI001FFE0ED7|nr:MULTISPECIES: hypothetical protein [Citrobacter]MCR3692075.1 hypothetical protein [Citrobacter freundii]MDM3085017.1 hypothetical protein [Citrobacter sp. Cf141]